MKQYGRMYFNTISRNYEIEIVGEIITLETGGYLDSLNEASNLGWELVCIDKDKFGNREYFLFSEIE